MKPMLWTLLGAVLISPAVFAGEPKCEAVVEIANQQITQKHLPVVQDTARLVALLRYLNQHNTLPAGYVTRTQAMQQGWSGKQEDSLWSAWTLNQKALGGDSYRGAIPASGNWFSANLDNVRGKPSTSHLIYSPVSKGRYLSTDDGASVVALPACE